MIIYHHPIILMFWWNTTRVIKMICLARQRLILSKIKMIRTVASVLDFKDKTKKKVLSYLL